MKRGTRFEALRSARALRGHRGPWAAAASRPGSNYLADDFQQEIAFWHRKFPELRARRRRRGALIRTLKENLLWVRSFATIEELLALLAFKRTSNSGCWRNTTIGPAQVRRDLVGLDAAA